jgi:nucleotide-binding universal stress UspA family protein
MGGGEEHGSLRVLVALDGSDGAERAADFVAIHLAPSAQVLAINVAPVPVPYAPSIGWGLVRPWSATAGMAVTAEEIDRRSDELRTAGRQAVAASPVDPDEVIIELGDPSDRILSAARHHGVGLIVVGASRDGLLSRVLHGSTSSELLRTHEFPVLVVP